MEARGNDATPKNEGLPWIETRTKLSYQIATQESGASKHRGNLSGDCAPAWRAVLDGWLLVGVFTGHNVMVASL
jgi:hypothetical protein